MNVPNHERKAFKDMTPEDRSTIVEAVFSGSGEHWSCFSGCWSKCEGDAVFSGLIYRTRPRQLVIPWDVIKPEYKWAAMDESGIVWMHKEEPGICKDGWFSTGNYASAILNIDTTGVDWRESLVQRPDGV